METGKRLLTKSQVAAVLGVGRRLVNEMFDTPGFPARGENGKTKYVWEPDLYEWVRKKWRK